MASSPSGNTTPVLDPSPVFISTEGEGEIGPQMGRAHYSYRLVSERFARLLAGAGFAPINVRMPEKYKRKTDLSALIGRDVADPVHIAFRWTENLRYMPSALNICHFAWEFEAISDRQLVSGRATSNQKRMLGLADEIWVPSNYTLNTLKKFGLEKSYFIPTPVCGAMLPVRLSKSDAADRLSLVPSVPMFLSSGLTHGANNAVGDALMDGLGSRPFVEPWRRGNDVRIFLTVLNPEDLRKNLLNMLEGFALATAQRGRDILVVKLSVPSGDYFGDSAPHECLRRRYLFRPVSIYHPRILFVWDYLDDVQLSALYSMADFYLSASHCEGQNLPLLEAMAHGTVALSTRNTAMLDYIGDDTAVVIREGVYSGAVPNLAGEITGVSPSVGLATRFDVAEAISAALSLTPRAYEEKSGGGRRAILDDYSEGAVQARIESRFEALKSGRKRIADAVS